MHRPIRNLLQNRALKPRPPRDNWELPEQTPREDSLTFCLMRTAKSRQQTLLCGLDFHPVRGHSTRAFRQLPMIATATPSEHNRVTLEHTEESPHEDSFVQLPRRRQITRAQARREVPNVHPASEPNLDNGSHFEANLNPDSEQQPANKARHSPPTEDTKVPKAVRNAPPDLRHVRHSKRIESRPTEVSQYGTSKRRVTFAQPPVTATIKPSVEENTPPAESQLKTSSTAVLPRD